MKQEIYKEYSKIYDFFNSPFMSNLFENSFFKSLINDIPENSHITEVGGGTGIFADSLLSVRPDIKLTFIEPSPYMFQIAEKRLSKKCIMHNRSLDEILPELHNQDLFIFMRVLYALYNNIEVYKALFSKLYKKLNNQGVISIFEVETPYHNLDKIKEIFETKINQEEEFNDKWPLMKNILKEFNRGVKENVYTIFTPEQLHILLASAGFTKVFSRNTMYIYKKIEIF